MKIKFSLAGILLALLAANLPARAEVASPAIIPLPQKMEVQPGTFQLTAATTVYVDFAARGTDRVLTDRLRQATGYPIKTHTEFMARPFIPGAILLTTKHANTNLGPEGYELTVSSNAVVVRAPTTTGLFYGVQTLFQLLPPEIFSATPTNADWQMPCVHIEDWPRFQWRGLMLDVCRHFYTKAEVETVLDTMALHKLNRFHWHLTDDQGWRIEIKKYPLLTQVGAWRAENGFGLDPKSSTAYGPDGRYGGFYTQDDIREVVAYAAARHIIVVPEIEMPGHSSAALAAYPQFSCTGGPYTIPTKGGVMYGIYDPAKPETFDFLDDVLTEVFQLFPDKYVHIGGDEVPKTTWHESPDCQALMQKEGLKNEEELQSWIVRRMEKFISSHNRTMIGWSEILQGGLAQNAVVMDWIGGGSEAASSGHDAIMSPTPYCYFDYYQSTNHATEPRAIGGFTPLHKVYAFNPVPANLSAADAAHILGTQGNLWTEYIPNLKHAEFMIYPRETALAEVAWSAQSERDFTDFSRRLQVQYQRFDVLGVNYRRSPWSPDGASDTSAAK